MKNLIQKIKDWCKRHIDYEIVGEYYDTDKDGRYIKKYNRKYFIRIGNKKFGKKYVKINKISD